MIIIRSIRILTCALSAIAMTGLAEAQLSASLKLSKRQYVAGEPVIAVVTVTNHSGQTLDFSSDGRIQWLDFNIKNSHGESITPRSRKGFGRMTMKAGESLAREVNLAELFQLSEPGNLSVSAVVRMPGNTGEGTATNRVLFNQSPGVPYWTQKVGIPGRAGQTREFRVLNFSGDERAQIYAQVIDGRTGNNVRTLLLGAVLMLRKPLVTVDKQQRLHVMYLATPTLWVHCQIDTDGTLVGHQVHRRGAQGDPQLLTFGDGTVRVSNSIPVDQKAAAEAKAKIRKASDRPAITY